MNRFWRPSLPSIHHRPVFFSFLLFFVDGWMENSLPGNEFSDNGLIIRSSSSSYQRWNCYLCLACAGRAGHARRVHTDGCPLAWARIHAANWAASQGEAAGERAKKTEKMITFKQGKMINRETNGKKSISSFPSGYGRGLFGVHPAVDLFAREAPRLL
jgi:hypothetical protein